MERRAWVGASTRADHVGLVLLRAVGAVQTIARSAAGGRVLPFLELPNTVETRRVAASA